MEVLSHVMSDCSSLYVAASFALDGTNVGARNVPFHVPVYCIEVIPEIASDPLIPLMSVGLLWMSKFHPDQEMGLVIRVGANWREPVAVMRLPLNVMIGREVVNDPLEVPVFPYPSVSEIL